MGCKEEGEISIAFSVQAFSTWLLGGRGKFVSLLLALLTRFHNLQTTEQTILLNMLDWSPCVVCGKVEIVDTALTRDEMRSVGCICVTAVCECRLHRGDEEAIVLYDHISSTSIELQM